jgi:hypothetical protein
MRKLIIALAAAAPLSAQAPAVRLIRAPDASTRAVFGTIAAVRQLPNGQLLVNDVARRQLALVDQPFTTVSIVADSTSGSPNSYGTRPGGLIAYRGDSSLFVDPAGLSMFVLDPKGAITRVASVPRSQDAAFIGNNLIGTPGVDANGRLIYRSAVARVMPSPGGAGRGVAFPEPPDSAPLLRIDLATRKLDTLAYYKIPKLKMNITQTERGISATSEINPLPTVDDWAVMSDGAVAMIRGQDYHVEFIDPSGERSSAAKIPFDWQRLTDDDKVAVLDSAKTAIERARATGQTNGGGAGGGALGGMVVMMRSDDGGGGGGAPRISTGAPGNLPPVALVSASDLPDYRPAFGQGAARADLDGNLWIRTSATRAGAAGFIYDVINRRGELAERVQIPAGRQIVGFGSGGVVYMAARDDHGSWLERTHR